MRDQAMPPVAGEIEDVYVEIGRMVVQSAIRQAQAASIASEDGIETTVAVRVLFDERPVEQSPTTCCICTQDVEGVWVCAGPCCPTHNST
jgi:hypothetical protein